jgi:hypothetical protein
VCPDGVRDADFKDALALAKSQIHFRRLEADWPDRDAWDFVNKCVGLGEGVKLALLFGGGYSFASLGGSTSNSGGAPSPDQVHAFEAFQSIRP